MGNGSTTSESENEDRVTIELRENGPIVVTGPVTLEDGTETSHRERLFLCRCGDSAKKPLCDGTHKSTGFQAPGCEPPQRS